MKRTFIATVLGVALSAFMFTSATAQVGPFSSVDVAPKFALPDGRGLGPGFGVEYIGNYDINEDLVVTATTGFLYFLEDDFSGMAVPIMAGVKYTVMPDLFVGAELGIHWWRTKVDLGPFGSATNTSNELTITPMVGYTVMDKYTIVGQIALGDADYIGVRVNIPVW